MIYADGSRTESPPRPGGPGTEPHPKHTEQELRESGSPEEKQGTVREGEMNSAWPGNDQTNNGDQTPWQNLLFSSLKDFAV